MIWTNSSNLAGNLRRSVVGLLTLGVVCALAPLSHAESDSAIAEALFREAKALMKKKRYVEACPKFAESQRMDPASGTMLALALCHEKEGKTASAWSEYLEAAALARRAGHTKRKKAALKRASALEPKLSRLTLQVDPAVKDLEGLEIRFDKVTLEPAVWGTAMPVDPGDHTLKASAPGKVPWSTEVSVKAGGETQEMAVPPLQNAPVEPEPPTEPEPPPAATQHGPGERDVPPPSSGAKRTAGFIVGGVGIAALGVGTYFGFRAMSKIDDAQSRCSTTNCTDPEAIELNDDGRLAADISTAAIGVGILGVGVGTYLLLTSGSDDESPRKAAKPGELRLAPTVGLRGAGVAIGGAW